MHLWLIGGALVLGIAAYLALWYAEGRIRRKDLLPFAALVLTLAGAAVWLVVSGGPEPGGGSVGPAAAAEFESGQ